MKIGYFPGCSLHATSREYAESLSVIARALDIELDEIEDWACCGATSAHATNHLLGMALPARTIALAAKQGHDEILAPCAACYNRLASVSHALKKDEKLVSKLESVIERPLQHPVRIISAVRYLHGLIPDIKKKVNLPLKDLKVACYYGCLLVRPPELNDMDDVESPTIMESVVKATGAQPVKWNRRLDCCGGGFSLSRTSSVIRLSRSLLEDAHAAGAHAVVTACPMCHSNLDFRQKAIARSRGEAFNLPVLFLSQLVGLSLGEKPADLGLNRHFVSTLELVDGISKAGGDTAATEVS